MLNGEGCTEEKEGIDKRGYYDERRQFMPVNKAEEDERWTPHTKLDVEPLTLDLAFFAARLPCSVGSSARLLVAKVSRPTLMICFLKPYCDGQRTISFSLSP